MTPKTEGFKVRSAFYELIDELNGLDSQVWKRTHSKEIRMRFKKVKSLATKLEKFLSEPHHT